MATGASNSLSLPSSSVLVDSKPPRQPASAPPQCVSLPSRPPPPANPQSRLSKTTAYCRKVARNVIAMATGDAPALVAAEAPGEIATPELPEIVKTVQEAWSKVEDKYAVTSLAAAGFIAVWCASGVISAIDRLPVIPGVFEVVGIGYTGWFVYKNLIFQPQREALLSKIKETYSEIIGSG
ncbi:hypothetical protein Nepgr_033169 [Nepenthes gracilis]|uniref:Cyanobacterial aminoacyl-tRNA synthetase CAAD domain-containing protein n=1 Tax=Nepenthes gracilis TaxID=150966 RepID=A0AAD3TLL5_NEPGR|nr:hypothetical protein Nepgr_033169 [Nepenthes gracilis]